MIGDEESFNGIATGDCRAGNWCINRAMADKRIFAFWELIKKEDFEETARKLLEE